MTEFLIFDVAVETRRLKLMMQDAEKMDNIIPFTRLQESARFVSADTAIKYGIINPIRNRKMVISARYFEKNIGSVVDRAVEEHFKGPPVSFP